LVLARQATGWRREGTALGEPRSVALDRRAYLVNDDDGDVEMNGREQIVRSNRWSVG
jgi:hypothetical protein